MLGNSGRCGLTPFEEGGCSLQWLPPRIHYAKLGEGEGSGGWTLREGGQHLGPPNLSLGGIYTHTYNPHPKPVCVCVCVCVCLSVHPSGSLNWYNWRQSGSLDSDVWTPLGLGEQKLTSLTLWHSRPEFQAGEGRTWPALSSWHSA